MRGAPRPEIRIGDLGLDDDLRPVLVADDDVRHPIRRVMDGGAIEEVWASELVIVDHERFEMAIILREMER